MKSCWINHGEHEGHGKRRKELTTDYTDKHGWGKENLAWMHKMNRIWIRLSQRSQRAAKKGKEKTTEDTESTEGGGAPRARIRNYY